MKKTTRKPAQADVIGKALAARRPRRPQRMAREPAVPAEPATPPPAEPAAPVSIERPAAPAAAPQAESKISGVVALLKRADGATLAELIEATGWLPHTTRAALTGLRKKGHVLAKDKRGEVTCYRITEAA